ncbi:hypothetical protein ACGFOU_20055 [Streptomyces sp. NPDC048595]|uniref:hypothetical protein n=1 Tax=Streptomyces sp. NPDC048595 TaxID=3365576 RepID=UPI003724AD4E
MAAAAPTSRLRAVVGYVHPGDGIQHVDYIAGDSHVHELWWKSAWHHNDLTLAAS